MEGRIRAALDDTTLSGQDGKVRINYASHTIPQILCAGAGVERPTPLNPRSYRLNSTPLRVGASCTQNACFPKRVVVSSTRDTNFQNWRTLGLTFHSQASQFITFCMNGPHMGAQDAKVLQFCTEFRCGSNEHGPGT